MARRRRRVLRWFLLLILLVILAVAGVLASLAVPYAGFEHDTFVDIRKGTGTRGIAHQLSENAVIRWPWQFELVRALRPRAHLQAGEYRFASPASIWTVFDRIARGDIFYYELAVPEGANMFEIGDRLQSLGVMSSADFLKAAHNAALIRDLAPRAPTLEGYLFPSTYRITRHMTAQQVCRVMTAEFRKRWHALKPPADAPPVNEVVTMASLVEKETAQPGERPEIASVYWNRLKTGMALDCDPTTIYAAMLDNRYRGTIYRSDLHSANPYNTYMHAGLPPGPIANPGIASLKAALFPANTDYVYFVARPDGSGGHAFSTTLAQHERNVQAYRRGQHP